MTETDNVEQKLDQLIELCQQLKRENQILLDREAGLIGERSELIEKNEMARQKIEALINRLRSMSAEQ
jgi:cell division protein ZapB